MVISEAQNSTIGGTAANAGNVISGNDQYGVVFVGDIFAEPTSNALQGNFIGTNAAGTAALRPRLDVDRTGANPRQGWI